MPPLDLAETASPAVLVISSDPDLVGVVAAAFAGRRSARIVGAIEPALADLLAAPAEVIVFDDRSAADPVAAVAGVRALVGEVPAILALTGDDARIEPLVAAGATDFLTRPFGPARLLGRLAVLDRTLRRARDARAEVTRLAETGRAAATLLANLPGMVYRCANDREFTAHFVSDGCLELTGHAPAEFLAGRVHLGGLIHADDRDKVWDAVQQGLEHQRPFRVTFRIATASGALKWLWQQGQGVFGPAGELLALEGVITDLSELRRTQIELEEREVLLETLLAVTSTAYILCDDAGAIVYANLAAQTWLKLPDSRLFGSRFAEVLTSLPQELRDAVGRGRDSIFTVDHQSGDFEAYHLVMRSVQIGGKAHIAYAFKRLTRELARQEVEVWKKVIRLIAHEINNTLAPISSLLHSARLINAAEARDARLDRIIDTISERSKHLGEFLKGYTQFARLPRPRLEPVKWRQLIDRLEDLVQFKIDAAPEHLNTVAAIDRSQIEQALINLLKNAVEAGGPPDEVTLRLRTGPEGDELQVLDRGPGIPPELLSKVLLPFYSTKRTGSGLGLPLCREIVEAHGGSLRIEAREGGGTAVIMSLPRLTPP